MNILALDLATTTGWAHSCGESGVWDLSIKRDESGGMRFIRLRTKLEEIKELGLDVLVFESSNFSSKGRQSLGAELIGVVKLWCEDNGVEYRSYSSSEIKKHATGKGNSGKDLMVAAANKKFHVGIIDDNHADALWLLDLAKKDLRVA